MNDSRTAESSVQGSKSLPDNNHRIGRTRRRRRLEQRYWEFFINAPPHDPLNQLPGPIRNAPQGSVNSVKSDTHTPEIMSEHIKEIAGKFGSDQVGIIALDPQGDGPSNVPEQARFAIVCVVSADYDPATSPGIGGQTPVQNGLMISFILAAFLRESGYFATMRTGSASELAELAVRAGLGNVDRHGRLRSARFGTNVWVADVVYTDFPLAGRS